ncbi:type II toxin-antitoxin system PrlF family antitoxin [Pseudomonas moraviensis]|uniref:type II toxin-antitoxin system PrlF family antitoxin n=1 Tax=Pseudomonas moraviensis TaxID=321662 RepID=UPI0018D9F673|nr:type II toxin-antitoxin system PrlF family antitoxin [Pseudomonas moraviensis]MBH3442358.1 type II toxin-antitoxin system PrlF family antitoxin [Pseudomonas moraviensis]
MALVGGEPLKEDSAVVRMLEFLAADILHRLEELQPLNWELIARITSLVGDVDVDLNAPLVFDDE